MKLEIIISGQEELPNFLSPFSVRFNKSQRRNLLLRGFRTQTTFFFNSTKTEAVSQQENSLQLEQQLTP